MIASECEFKGNSVSAFTYPCHQQLDEVFGYIFARNFDDSILCSHVQLFSALLRFFKFANNLTREFSGSGVTAVSEQAGLFILL